MQRARAPAISIKTKGFIRGRKMLLNPGMIPQILQENRKTSCQPALHHYFEIPNLLPLFSIWLLTHLAVIAYDESYKGPTNSVQRLLSAKINQLFFSGNTAQWQSCTSCLQHKYFTGSILLWHRCMQQEICLSPVFNPSASMVCKSVLKPKLTNSWNLKGGRTPASWIRGDKKCIWECCKNYFFIAISCQWEYEERNCNS